MGKVYAWGNNSSGQLGNGTNSGSNVPILSLLNITQYEYQPQYSPNVALSIDNDEVLLSLSENEVQSVLLDIEYKIDVGEYQVGNNIRFSEEGIYQVKVRSINPISGLNSPEKIVTVTAAIDPNIVLGLINPVLYEDYGEFIDVYPAPAQGYIYVEHSIGINIMSWEGTVESISDTISKISYNGDSVGFEYYNGTILGIYEGFDDGIRLTLIEEELEWLGHQVDGGNKWRIELSDILPYMAAYRQGALWYGEAIGRDGVALYYVLNAMAIYRQGEYYERLEDVEEPNCWVALSV
jgi:hypothetical protein